MKKKYKFKTEAEASAFDDEREVRTVIDGKLNNGEIYVVHLLGKRKYIAAFCETIIMLAENSPRRIETTEISAYMETPKLGQCKVFDNGKVKPARTGFMICDEWFEDGKDESKSVEFWADEATKN